MLQTLAMCVTIPKAEKMRQPKVDEENAENPETKEWAQWPEKPGV